jgi:hypothetical protein
MKSTVTTGHFPVVDTTIAKGDKVVSYSQYSKYMECPKRWELGYARRLREDKPSIHLVFGEAVHTVVQAWLTVLYTKSEQEADTMDLPARLLPALKASFVAMATKSPGFTLDSAELQEFYFDGCNLLDWLHRRRTDYFSTRHLRLVGVEVPIYLPPADDRPTVKLLAYLDLVFYDPQEESYTIVDLKTSTKGWSDWDKRDEVKLTQVLLYKVYFAKQYNVPQDKINVEFFVVRRKVVEAFGMFGQRVQVVRPSQGSVSCARAEQAFESFVRESFTVEGAYNLERVYPAIEGPRGNTCRFCEFKDRDDLCPRENRRP